MKTTIVVEIKQSAAILAGKKEYGRQFVEIDPAQYTEKQKQTLLTLGIDRANDHPGSYYRLEMGDYGEATQENITKRLDEITTMQAQKRSEIEKEKENLLAKWLAMGDEEFADISLNYPSDIQRLVIDDPRMSEKLQRRTEIRKARQEAEEQTKAAEKARQEAEKERQEAEKEVIRQQKNDFVRVWIAEHGTESQKERHAANLLPLSEILDAVEEQLFAPLSEEKEYEKMQSGDVEHSERCDEYDNEGCDVDWDVEDADSATSDQWERMKALKGKIGRDDAKVTLREHRGTTDCKETTSKCGILIELTEGGYEFSREYTD